jgi:anti-anti-sigma factor
MAMVYTLENSNDGTEAVIEGMITFKDHNRFTEIMNVIKTISGKKMIINLHKVDFIDSAAIGMLLIANDKGAENNVDVIIKGAHGKVKSVLEAASFDKLFKFED